MPLYAKRTSQIDTENAFKIGPHITGIEKQGHEVVKLNLGEPDFDIPMCVKEAIKESIDKNETHYSDPKGLLGLREAITEHVLHYQKVTVSPEQVVVFPGAKPSIGFSQQVYCDPGDEIIYPNPGFPIYESFVKYIGAQSVPINLSESDAFTFSAEHLKSKITKQTKLIILNFPSNPTGGVASKKQLEEIAEVILSTCHKTVRIYSDEIYENIIFDGKEHFSIASIPGMQDKTIISSGFSKSFAWTGGRIGYAVLPSIEEANIFKNLNINYFSCIPVYNQMGAIEALVNPESKKAVKAMVAKFQERRDFMWEQLNAISGIHCLKPKGAFYLFPNIQGVCETIGAIDAYQALPASVQAQTSPSTLFQMFALYHHHVAAMDRRSFGQQGSQNEHYLRISYAADKSLLEQGIQRLSKACSDLNGFQQFIHKGENLYA